MTELEDVFGETGLDQLRDMQLPAGRHGAKKITPGFGSKKPKTVSHTHRAIKAMDELHPGKYWRAEYDHTNWQGMVSKKDVLGFMDIMGVERGSGRLIGCQTTTPGALSNHYRKYTSVNHTTGSDKVPIEFHLREFLECGGLFYILTFDKPGRLWEHKVIPFTLDTIAEIYSRKRKK